MNKLFINYYFLNNLLCTKNHSTSHLPQESNGLPLTGESCLGLTFDIYYLENKREIRGRYETDRQTDRQTPGQSGVCSHERNKTTPCVYTCGTKRRHSYLCNANEQRCSKSQNTQKKQKNCLQAGKNHVDNSAFLCCVRLNCVQFCHY